MTEITTAQLNKMQPYARNYIRVYKPLLGAFTPSTVLVAAEVGNYSGTTLSDGSKETYKHPRKVIAERLGISYSSAWRGVEALKSRDFLKIEHKDKPEYLFDFSKLNTATFIRCEREFLTNVYEFKDGTSRRLSDLEALVLSYIYTYCNNAKSKDKYIDVTNKELAAYLHASESGISRAVLALMHAGLIHRAEDERGRGNRKSRYHLDKSLYRRKKIKKPADVQEPAEPKPATPATLSRTEYEREFADRRHRAEELADNNLRRAMLDTAFKSIETELNSLNVKIAFAEYRAPASLPELNARRVKLEAQRRAALKRLGLSSNDLQPCRLCSKCNDTGYLSTGERCGCYGAFRTRGSPPEGV